MATQQELIQCIRILREILARDLEQHERDLVEILLTRYEQELGTKKELH